MLSVIKDGGGQLDSCVWKELCSLSTVQEKEVL